MLFRFGQCSRGVPPEIQMVRARRCGNSGTTCLPGQPRGIAHWRQGAALRRDGGQSANVMLPTSANTCQSWRRDLSTSSCPPRVAPTGGRSAGGAGVIGLGVVAALGGSVYTAKRASQCEEAPMSSIPELVNTLPQSFQTERSTVCLYQFESCPFCRKVRSCLDYKQIPYTIVEVNPLTKAETKPIAPDYKKVPILQVSAGDGLNVQLRDSKTITYALLGSTNPGVAPEVPPPRATPSTGNMWPQPPDKGAADAALGTTDRVEEQWLRWTDLVLVQCIVLNVYRTMEESAETFSYLLTHPSFPWYAKRSAAYSGTVVMWGVAMARKRRFKVKDERAAMFEAVDMFAEAVERGGGPFLGGARPGVVDFNVYGILRSAEGCQTERALLDHCTRILPWYGAMRDAVGASRAVNSGDVQRGHA